MRPTATYIQRNPKETLLYRLVEEHLTDFYDHVEQSYGEPLPPYVRNAFRNYLRCGILANGFLRGHCPTCNHDVLVAFSCKTRAPCPSCAARRMAGEAAFIVDTILPDVPVRQWVLTLPFEIRMLCAMSPKALSAMGRIFVDEIKTTLCASASLAKGHIGAINFPQRFGGSLNLHVHFHVVVPDGVFEHLGDKVFFHQTQPPSRAELHGLIHRVRDRALAWIKEHAKRINPNPETKPLDRCMQLAVAKGELIARSSKQAPTEFDAFESHSHRYSASVDGFDVHAAVTIAKDDDVGRERLLRYCARPTFAMDNLSTNRDGNVLYRVKYPREGRTHRVMTPIEFLARLAALIPPPRYPLVRYHGIFAPNSKLRSLVVPKPRAPKPAQCSHNHEPAQLTTTPRKTTKRNDDLILARRPPETELSPMLTIAHWDRLQNGALLAATPRVDWATLMRRTFNFDTLRCPFCGQTLQVMAAVTNRTTAKAILSSVDKTQPARAPPLRHASI